MARRATIQLKVHGKVVQSVPLDREDIECLMDGLRQVTPCTPRVDRLVDLLAQIRSGTPRKNRGDLARFRFGWGAQGENRVVSP